MDRHIVCLQIPAFRIALARAADSALRNRPVAVAPTYTPRALIREISTEAFHEGLQPGIPVDLARLICPGLQLIPPDPSLTHAAHRELQHRISSFAPTWESIRPGSLFLDLTGTTRLLGPPIDTATRISRALIHQQGWPSIIGLAGNKLVSQLAATTLTKPPQMLSIRSGSEQSFLAPLPTLLLPGLHRTQTSRVLQRLEDLNLRTLGTIASVSLTHLQAVFGSPASLLHDWALGIDPSPVHPPITQPVIERSIRLDPDEVDDRVLLGRLYRLLEQICATLRQQQRMCRLIALTVRHSDHVEQTAQETLVHGTYWEVDLQPVLTRLFYRCFRRRVRLTHLRLQVGRLEPPAQQLSLFDESESCHPAFDFLTSVSCYRNGLVIFTSDKEALMAWATESRQDLYVELTPGPAMHDALLLSRHIDISNHGSFYSTFAYVSEARRMPLHAPSRYQTAIPLLKNGLMKSRRSAFWLAATL